MVLLRRVVGRLIGGAGVLWGAATLAFIAINATGGDTALAILGGPDALPTPEVLAHVRAEYGLDKPLLEQYGLYMTRFVRGDLGESYRLRIPVTKAIEEQIGPTVQLALCSSCISLVLAVGTAILTARRSQRVRSIVSGLELVVVSTPNFVLGILLLLLFSFRMHVFPAVGTQGWKTLVLPALTLALPQAAMLTQILRQDLEDILEKSFITGARARGMSDLGVRLFRALRHAMIPVVTWSSTIFALFLGGAVIAETLFARQGVGRLMFEAATNKDVPLVLGITLMAAVVYVVINIIVDLTYSLIDPRLLPAER